MQRSQPRQRTFATIEVSYGQQVLKLSWPTSDPEGCARAFMGWLIDSYNAIWLATEPMDMHAGTKTALAREIAALRLSLHQPLSESDESTGARWRRDLSAEEGSDVSEGTPTTSNLGWSDLRGG